jgi:hypothetical protein
VSRYLTPEELERLVGPTGTFACTIRQMRREIIDGRPQLVLYIDEDPRGIIVTRALYEDLTAVLGPSPFADAFFRKEGLQ